MQDENPALADMTSVELVTIFFPTMRPESLLILHPSSFILSPHGPSR